MSAVAIGVRRSFGVEVRALAAASRATLDGGVGGAPGDVDDAELWLATPSEDAVTLGAFARARGDEGPRVVRRGSGGPAVRIGSGTLYVALRLPRVDALAPVDVARIVNRYVRPLLRALTRCGARAAYFGRDWISVAHRPAAWVGFAHDARSGRAALEAFVACDTPFDAGPRASYLGKAPSTLRDLVGRAVDPEPLAAAVVAAFAEAYGHAAIERGPLPAFTSGPDPAAEPPWAATVEAPIGLVGAGPDASGAFRVGGDLLVSRDALDDLERALATTPDGEVPGLVEATLGSPRVALDGVRPGEVAALIVRARAAGDQKRA